MQNVSFYSVDTQSPLQLSCPCIAIIVGIGIANSCSGAIASWPVAEFDTKTNRPDAAVAAAGSA